MQKLKSQFVHYSRTVLRKQRKSLSVHNVKRYYRNGSAIKIRNIVTGFTVSGAAFVQSDQSTTSSLGDNPSAHMGSNSTRSDFIDNNEVIDILPDEMQIRRGNKPKYIIIDVRETYELEDNFHLDGTDWINIPKKYFLQSWDLSSLKKSLLETFHIDILEYDEIYCICKVGGRSAMVAEHLLSLQINTKIFNILGGMREYNSYIVR